MKCLAGDCRLNMVDSQSGLAVAEKIERVHAPELVDFLAQAWALGAAPADDVDLLFADTFAHQGLHAPQSRRKAADHAGAFGQIASTPSPASGRPRSRPPPVPWQRH